MKKLFYLLAVASVLVSCGGKGYTVTGAVAGASDGDSLFIMERVGRDFQKVDSTVIAQGKFTFKGEQEIPVNRYLVYTDDEKPMYVDFFLENGAIQVSLGEGKDAVTGTPLNDAYQTFKDEMQEIIAGQRAIYQSLSNPDLTDEEKEAKMAEYREIEANMIEAVKSGIDKNIHSHLGAYLIGQYNYYLDYADLEPMLEKMPADLQKLDNIVRLKETIGYAKATEVGKMFTDLSMATPEGEPIKLSDIAGQGKYVLVDFWASWCGPCRREMPKLVEAYAKYKNKDFEIVGVSLDRDGEAWKKGIEQLGITWPQMSDLKYWDSEASKLYAVRGIPHLMLLDKDGTILFRGLSGDEVGEKLAELLK